MLSQLSLYQSLCFCVKFQPDLSSLPVNVINWQPAISDITAEESLNPEVLHFKLAVVVFKFHMYFLARNSTNNCQIFLLFGNWMKQSVTDLNHRKHKIDTLGLSSSLSLQFTICKGCPGLNAVTDIKWNNIMIILLATTGTFPK